MSATVNRVRASVARRKGSQGGIGRHPTEVRRQLREMRKELARDRRDLENEQKDGADVQQEIEASHERYVDFYEFAPVGYLTLDRTGSILDLNLTAARLLGRERSHLIRRPFMPLVAKAERRAFLRHLRQVMRLAEEPATINLWVPRKDGQKALLQLLSYGRPETSPGPVRVRTLLTEVTEQRRAEEDRRRLAAIVEFSEDAIVGKDLDGIITSWNQGAEQLFGYSAREVIGKSITLLIPHERRGEEEAILDRIRRGQAVGHYDTIRRRKDGTEVSISLTVSPVRDAEGRVIGASKIARDITRRKQAEEGLRRAKVELEQRVQLRTAELTRINVTLEKEILAHKRAELAREQLVAIVESSSDAIWSRNLQDIIVSWNMGAERLLGYAASEIIGRSVWVLAPSERERELLQFHKHIQRGETIGPIETVCLHRDGHRLELSLTLSAIKDAKGQVTGISAIARDISDRKRAERALRQSEARLQAIMDNSPAMIFLKDIQGRYLHYNREFARIFHVSRGEGIGKTDFEIFPRAQATAFRAHDRKVVATGKPIQFEEVAPQDDGPHVSIVSKFPLYDEEGKIYAIGGIVADITERRRLEGEVLRISERERMRIAQDLHDGLGQQLAGTWYLADTLRKNLAAQSSPEVSAAAKIVQLLDTAVSQCRDLARGLYPVAREPNGLVSALQELASHASDLFKVDCSFVCDQAVLVEDNDVAANLYRIAQEAVNNAVKHGRARSIVIGLSAGSERLTLRVTDDGVGFGNVAKTRKGMGLRTMNHRADLIGADFAIHPMGNCGTEMICSLQTQSIALESNAKTKRKQKGVCTNPDRG